MLKPFLWPKSRALHWGGGGDVGTSDSPGDFASGDPSGGWGGSFDSAGAFNDASTSSFNDSGGTFSDPGNDAFQSAFEGGNAGVSFTEGSQAFSNDYSGGFNDGGGAWSTSGNFDNFSDPGVSYTDGSQSFGNYLDSGPFSGAGVDFTGGSQQFGNFFDDASSFYPADSGGWNNFVSANDSYFGGDQGFPALGGMDLAADFGTPGWIDSVDARSGNFDVPTGMDLAGDLANPANSSLYGGGWGPNNVNPNTPYDAGNQGLKSADEVFGLVGAPAALGLRAATELAVPLMYSGLGYIGGGLLASRETPLPEVNVNAPRTMDVELVPDSPNLANPLAPNLNPEAPQSQALPQAQSNTQQAQAAPSNATVMEAQQGAPPSLAATPSGAPQVQAMPGSIGPPAPPNAQTVNAEIAQGLAKAAEASQPQATQPVAGGPPLAAPATSQVPPGQAGFLSSATAQAGPDMPNVQRTGPFSAIPGNQQAQQAKQQEADQKWFTVAPPTDKYLAEVYGRTPQKVDNTGDFTWKDAAAASRYGKGTAEYAIGGLDKDFKTALEALGKAMDRAGIPWSLSAGFRDNYRQSITSGFRASTTGSMHGGTGRLGGDPKNPMSTYGRGQAVDVTGVAPHNPATGRPDNRAVWDFIDKHGAKFGISRNLGEKDPPHVQPTGKIGQIAEAIRSGADPMTAPVQQAGRGPGASRDSRNVNLTPEQTAVRGQNLASQREAPVAELRGNSSLMDNFARVVWSEIGSKGDDRATLAQIESMLNAARANQISMADVVAGKHGPNGSKSGYFPGTPGRMTGREARSALANRANMPAEFTGKVAELLARAARGSDEARGATGNASGGKGAGTITARIGGEKFGVEGYAEHRAWQQALNIPAQPATAVAALPPTADVPDQDMPAPPGRGQAPYADQRGGGREGNYQPQRAGPLSSQPLSLDELSPLSSPKGETGVRSTGPGGGWEGFGTPQVNPNTGEIQYFGELPAAPVYGGQEGAEADYGANYGPGPDVAGQLAPGWLASDQMQGARSGAFEDIGTPMWSPGEQTAGLTGPGVFTNPGDVPAQTLQDVGAPPGVVQAVNDAVEVAQSPAQAAELAYLGAKEAGATELQAETAAQVAYETMVGPELQAEPDNRGDLPATPFDARFGEWDTPTSTFGPDEAGMFNSGKGDLQAANFDSRFGEWQGPAEYAGPLAGPDVVGGRSAPEAQAPPGRGGIGSDWGMARGADPGLAPSLAAIGKGTPAYTQALSSVISNMPAAQRGQMEAAIKGLSDQDKAAILNGGVSTLVAMISKQSGYPASQVQSFLNNSYQSFGYPGYPGGLAQLGQDLAAANQFATANAVPGRSSPQFQDASIVANVQDMGFPGLQAPSQAVAPPPADVPTADMPATPSLPEVTVETTALPPMEPLSSPMPHATGPGGIYPIGEESQQSGVPGGPPAATPTQSTQEVLSNPQSAAIVQDIAASYGVDIGTAALIYRLFFAGDIPGEEFPMRAMRDGGRPYAGEPVLVGEEGPELFVPDVPGAIYPYVPAPGQGNRTWPKAPTPDYPGKYAGYGREVQRQYRLAQDPAPLIMNLIEADALRFNPYAWEAFLKAQKPSKNIEDRRKEKD